MSACENRRNAIRGIMSGSCVTITLRYLLVANTGMRPLSMIKRVSSTFPTCISRDKINYTTYTALLRGIIPTWFSRDYTGRIREDNIADVFHAN